jgi:hypothetical protein
MTRRGWTSRAALAMSMIVLLGVQALPGTAQLSTGAGEPESEQRHASYLRRAEADLQSFELNPQPLAGDLWPASGGLSVNDLELPPGGSFHDDDTSVHQSDIEAIAFEGITKGCNPPTNTRFCPTDFVTRGQMAAFLRRALGLPSSSVDWFVDDDGSIFEADINALAESEITKGCNPPVNDRFCPDGKVSRGQMAAFLRRALSLPASSVDWFIDDDGSIFEADINALAESEITKGCNPPVNDRFCPNDPVQRAHMASFLKRALGLTAITPPSRLDTLHGFDLDLLLFAEQQGCNIETATFCEVSVTIPPDTQFFVLHGWIMENWSSQSKSDQTLFQSDRVRFDLAFDSIPVRLFQSFAVENDVAIKPFHMQFPPNYAHPHVLVGDFVWDDQIALRLVVFVDFG